MFIEMIVVQEKRVSATIGFPSQSYAGITTLSSILTPQPSY
jgi:hypothetical protein